MAEVIKNTRQRGSEQSQRTYSLLVQRRSAMQSNNTADVEPVLHIVGDGLDGLNISFDISKTSDNKNTEGNSAAIEIYNLNGTQIAQLDEGKDLYAILSVRYSSSADTITLFQGVIKDTTTRQTGTEIITQILIGDGYSALNESKLKGFVPPGSTVEQVLSQIVDAIPNVSRGSFTGTNLNTAVASGWRISGDAKTVLKKFCEAQQLEYNIDNGVINVTSVNMPSTSDILMAPVISVGTGMIDRPFWMSESAGKAAKDKRRRRRLHVKALINPAVTPASLVVVDVKGELTPVRVREIRYTGEYRGNPWEMELVCTEVTSDDLDAVDKSKKSNKPTIDYSKDNTIQ